MIKDQKNLNSRTKIHRLIEMWENCSLALSLLCFGTIDVDQPIKEASYRCGGGGCPSKGGRVIASKHLPRNLKNS